MTREEWLTAIVDRARPMFEDLGYPLPVVRIGAAPQGRPGKFIGLCWSDECSEDGAREIWVSPTLTDPLEIAGTVVHELCHAALPFGVKHGAPFKRLGTEMLLEGKPTQMTGGKAFAEAWGPWLDQRPPYPHARFDASKRPKQTTRMIKGECTGCGFVFRTTRKWIEEAGGDLTCPACQSSVELS